MDLAEIIIGGGTLAVALVAQGIAVTTTIVKIRRADQARAEERQQQLEQKLEDKSRELDAKLEARCGELAGKLREAEQRLADFKAEAAARFASMQLLEALESRFVGAMKDLTARIDRILEQRARIPAAKT